MSETTSETKKNRPVLKIALGGFAGLMALLLAFFGGEAVGAINRVDTPAGASEGTGAVEGGLGSGHSDDSKTHDASFSFYEILFAGHLSFKDETGRMKVTATYGGVGVGGGKGSGTLTLDPDGHGYTWQDLYTKSSEAHIYTAPATLEIDFTYTWKDNSGNWHQERLAKFTGSMSVALGTMDGPTKKWESY
jgi:hypothetical protein